MAEYLKNRPDGDPARIDTGDSRQFARWMQTLGVTEAKLRAAIAAAGPSVDAVRRYLGK
ncbi:MAG: DUF3606 domain-containing protein [Variovorax sp.]